MSKLNLIFEKQWLHAFSLAVLIALLVLAQNIDGIKAGALCGIGTTQWFWFAVSLPIAHQVFIWFCWRVQLNGNWIIRIFGNRGFPVYASVFFLFGALRVIAIFALAISNRNTLTLDITILRIFAIIITIPALYLLYSVIRYFSFKRAMGIDHFDESYRSRGLVRDGIFRFTRNGMYIFAFLFLWVPALWCASIAALCVALFSHAYIWVHYYSTELPDMKRIYGESKINPEGR
jgi:protein-S-isoprenylcysteine O-methyltransferase Ste14